MKRYFFGVVVAAVLAFGPFGGAVYTNLVPCASPLHGSPMAEIVC